MRLQTAGLAALFCVGGLLAWPAYAVNKCETGGNTIYSDQPCPAGSTSKGLAIGVNAVDPASAAAAAKRASAEKAELNRIESERDKQESASQKARERNLRAREREQKRCNALVQRKKWAEEDAATADPKNSRKAQAKARRLAERYESECLK